MAEGEEDKGKGLLSILSLILILSPSHHTHTLRDERFW
jgi:hypothetical protein